MDNFVQGIVALTRDMGLFLTTMLYNKLFVGFASGMGVSILLTGFVVTKDPRRIPLILRYSSAESFQKIATRSHDGIYHMSFVHFLKMYTQLRMLSFIACTTFFIMVTVITLAHQP